jgi:putative ABC transport system permease protein
MPHVGEWLRRIWYLLNRRRLEAALQEEMEAHRAMMGEPRWFGNTLQLREKSRDVWGWAWFDAVIRDIRFAIRGLRRTPVFTLVATLSLALGLALTTSTVSVVNAYLIRSLPYPDADRLYHVRYAPPGPWEPRGMTGLDWQSVEDVVEFPVAASGESFYLSDGGYTLSVRGLRVTRGFVEGLGVSVATGRRFTEEDFVAGSEPVALVGHSLWRDRFGSDPGTIGRVIRGEAESRPGSSETFRIVGVLPPGFYFGRDSRASVDLLVPHASPVRTYMVRLREGVPAAAAERRLTEAARRAATSPIPDGWTGVQLESAHERSVGTLRPVLLGMTVAVSLVLVIVCANVAVLMLLRSMQRQKEVAVRLALGSGWRHVARMLLTETTLICAAALGAGIALTAFLLATSAPLIETQLGRPAPSASGIALDTTVLLVVGGISLLLAVSLSLLPLRSWRRGLPNALRQDGRVASDGPSMRRLRSGLIALEIAGSLVLLVGCGLMIRSVVTMVATDFGFDMDGLTKSRVMLRARNYPDAAAYRRFHEGFAARLSALTGSPVAFSSWGPFFAAPAHVIEPDVGAAASAGALAVSAGYFSTFGIDIRQGREFTAEEASTEAPVAVISETLARRLWPAGSAMGRRVRGVEQTAGGSTAGPWRTVIGIARDVRQTYDDADRGDFYTPKTPDGRFGTFYVRTQLPLPLLFDHFRSAAAEIDRDAVINEPRRLADDDQTLAGTRFLTYLLTGFAAIAAFLAMLGIYGVTAYAVQQRQKEVAIRVALGASERAVVRIFVRDGVVLLGVGTLVGLIGGATLSRVLRNQVFGVESFDVSTYVAACVLLLAAGFTAVFWAARRAALADPVSALNAS